MKFSDFLNCLKPVLHGGKLADKVRSLVSLLTEIPDEVWGSGNDPSLMLSDATLAQYGNGHRKVSKKYAERIIRYLNKENFIQFLSSDDINEDALNIITSSFYAFDPSVNKLNIADKAADIIEDILKSCAGINVVNSHSVEIHRKSQTELSLEPYKDRLIVESQGKCPNNGCGNPMYITSDGNTKTHCAITIIDQDKQLKYDNLIALCPQCSQVYLLSPSGDKLSSMKQIKKNLSKREQILETLAPLDLENGITKVVARLSSFDESDYRELNYEPRAVLEKIPATDHFLLRKITQYVIHYFEFISILLKGFEREKVLNFQIVASQVKIAFLKLSDKELTRTQIFNHLVDWFIEVTEGSREACESVVSYFIQSCEVFHALSK